MSGPDNFLSRWSRRKLEPLKESGESVAPKTEQLAETEGDGVETGTSGAADTAQDPPQEPPFDPASLPSIESITASTDIRDFLKPGVPLSLSRAALRRAWTSDPAIRDFIGIAENQWDFTNDSIPGFGPIDPADVPRLLARIINSTKEGADAAAALIEDQSEISPPAVRETAVAKGEPGATDETQGVPPAGENDRVASNDVTESDPLHRSEENGAVQNDETDKELTYAQVRHGHGSALPT
jgi:hypothetical protein